MTSRTASARAGSRRSSSRRAATPEKCADLGHPCCTYNPWQDRTWCLCGEVVTDGNTVTIPHVACCGGPLTEEIS